ncbi:MurR/RpiR family transcriptional regulator [uncultured Cloacibacillus sp.]|uniref:MurR/RpiR family transcriptional regulator n=1 Tax=uncultured Cloacibacillus sp. TaxID=889794 RepID=UPI0025CCDE36|nr:MurR/RpiR family transcriptional regulator [uncultured Cloacibacillus sp.]
MEDLIKKIQNMSLSKTDTKIAAYVCDHLDTIGLQTSTAMAEKIGVSDTSVVRFVRKLGFKGYIDFRSAMKERILKKTKQERQGLSPMEKYAKSKELLKRDSLISDVSSYTLDNLEKSFFALDSSTLEQVVDILMKSDRKYIAGFRGTACCAQYMSSKLLFLTPNVMLITHADATAAERLIDITERDCLFLYSFPLHSEITKTLMDIARENKAKIILMTDSPTSPLANKADIVITARVDGLGFTNSYVAPLSLSELIILAVSSRCDETFSERFNRIDTIMKKEKLY